jgi:radical SAM superfamily enzyme
MAEPMLIAKTPHTTCELLPDWPTATGRCHRQNRHTANVGGKLRKLVFLVIMDDLTASASRQAQLAPSWRVLKERGIDALSLWLCPTTVGCLEQATQCAPRFPRVRCCWAGC